MTNKWQSSFHQEANVSEKQSGSFFFVLGFFFWDNGKLVLHVLEFIYYFYILLGTYYSVGMYELKLDISISILDYKC